MIKLTGFQQSIIAMLSDVQSRDVSMYDHLDKVTICTEYKLLSLTVPRMVGKSTVITSIAPSTYNPLIVVRNHATATSFRRFLPNYLSKNVISQNSELPRGQTLTPDLIFMDEIQDEKSFLQKLMPCMPAHLYPRAILSLKT